MREQRHLSVDSESSEDFAGLVEMHQIFTLSSFIYVAVLDSHSITTVHSSLNNDTIEST